jgi:glycosyltransferase TcdB-like subunit of Tc toxin
MDNCPWFDSLDQFDNRNIRLADIDGSGVTDIIYVGGSENKGIKIYFNQSGNRWSDVYYLDSGLQIDDSTSIQVADLMGNGTACLVWSSTLPGNSRKPLRYLDSMGRIKPHLLVKSANNLGAETQVEYVSSTKFYLADKPAGKPWITRLPFPIHVVERVITYDYIGLNLFVTRSAYHHGYFDGIEQEFRGFGDGRAMGHGRVCNSEQQ